MTNTAPLTRSERTTLALRAAALELLAEGGYSGLTIEKVAARSGVAKTSIYRRWGSKAEMVFELVLHGDAFSDPIDSGNLLDDVRLLSTRVVALVGGDVGRSVLPGLLADIAGDTALARRFQQTFIGSGREEIRSILARAVSRGELLNETKATLLHSVLLGTVYAWVHLFPQEVPSDLSDQLAELCMGVLRPIGGGGLE